MRPSISVTQRSVATPVPSTLPNPPVPSLPSLRLRGSQPLETISETLLLDSLQEMSGGVYEDPQTGKQETTVMLAGVPSLLSIDLEKRTVAVSASLCSFDAMVPVGDDASLSQGIGDVARAQNPRLLEGTHLTYLLYHSLASHAARLFFGAERAQETEDGELPSGLCVSLLRDVLETLKSQPEWGLCVSVWSVEEDAVFDLLCAHTRRQIIDSGTILFGRGMKSYRVTDEEGLRKVLFTALQNRSAHWRETVVCVGQIIDASGTFVGSLARSPAEIARDGRSAASLRPIAARMQLRRPFALALARSQPRGHDLAHGGLSRAIPRRRSPTCSPQASASPTATASSRSTCDPSSTTRTSRSSAVSRRTTPRPRSPSTTSPSRASSCAANATPQPPTPWSSSPS